MPNSVSFTSLESYRLCKYKFYYLYYAKLAGESDSRPAAIGTVTHAAGEDLLGELTSKTSFTNSERETIVKKYQAKVSANLKALVSRFNVSSDEIELALNSLDTLSKRGYLFTLSGDTYTPKYRAIESEYEFTETLINGALLHGFVDLIFQNVLDPNKYMFMDLKSGKRFGRDSYKADQVIIYDLAVSTQPAFSGKTIVLAYDFFMKEVNGNPLPEDEALVIVTSTDARKNTVSNQLLEAYNYLNIKLPASGDDSSTNPTRFCKYCPAFVACPDAQNIRLRESPIRPSPGILPYSTVKVQALKGSEVTKVSEDELLFEEIINRIILDGMSVNDAIAAGSDASLKKKYFDFCIDQREQKSKDILRDDRLSRSTDIQIGAVHITSPITAINIQETKELESFETLRTKEPMILRKEGSSREAVISITFSGADKINTELRHIIAQYQSFPYIQIRNKDLSRLLVPMDSHLSTYYALDKEATLRVMQNNPGRDFETVQEEADHQTSSAQREALYAKIKFMYALRSLSISPVPGLVDTIRLDLKVQLMDLDPISDVAPIRFLYNTQAALQQLGWFTHFNRLNDFSSKDPDGGKDIVDVIVQPSMLELKSSYSAAKPKLNGTINLAEYSVLAMPLYREPTNDEDPFTLPKEWKATWLGDQRGEGAMSSVGPGKKPTYEGWSPFCDKNSFLILVKTSNADVATNITYLPFIYIHGLLFPIFASGNKMTKNLENDRFDISDFTGAQRTHNADLLSFRICSNLSNYLPTWTDPLANHNTIGLWPKYISTSLPRSSGDIGAFLTPESAIKDYFATTETMRDHLKTNSTTGEWNYTAPVVPVKWNRYDDFISDIKSHEIVFNTSIIDETKMYDVFFELFRSHDALYISNLLPLFAGRANPISGQDLINAFNPLFSDTLERGFYCKSKNTIDGRRFDTNILSDVSISNISKLINIMVYENAIPLSQHSIALLNKTVSSIKPQEIKVGDSGTFMVMPPVFNKNYIRDILGNYYSYLNANQEYIVYGSKNTDADLDKQSSLDSDWKRTFCKRMSEGKLDFDLFKVAVKSALMYDLPVDNLSRSGMIFNIAEADIDLLINVCYGNYNSIFNFGKYAASKKSENGDPLNNQTIRRVSKNPTDISWTVDTMSLSKPYIKYYTSLLAEYDDPDRYADIVGNVPDYLAQPSYKQINQFPIMLPYEGKKSDPNRNEIRFFFRSLRGSSFVAEETPEKYNRTSLRIVNDYVLIGIRDIINSLLPGTSIEYGNLINNAASATDNPKSPENCTSCKCPDDEQLKKYIDGQLEIALRSISDKLSEVINDSSKISTDEKGVAIELLTQVRNILISYHVMVIKNDKSSNISRAWKASGSNPFRSFVYISSYLGGLLYLILERVLAFIEANPKAAASSGNLKIRMKLVKRILSNIFISDKPSIAVIKTIPQSLEIADDDAATNVIVTQLSNLAISASKLKVHPKVTVSGSSYELSDSVIISNAIRSGNDAFLIVNKSDTLSNSNINIESDVATLKRGILTCTMSMLDSFIPDLFKWKEFKVVNSTSRDANATTITNFVISQQNNVVPIFMEGHENPFPQCLGGSQTAITLEFVTDDIYLMENLAEAATELNVIMKKYNVTKSVNPLRSIFGTLPHLQKNDLGSLSTTDSRRKYVVDKIIKATTGTEPSISKSGVDTPTLIKNNIANMMGIYGCVITDISYESMEGKNNTFSVRISMQSVDVQQTDRETPRRADNFYERSLLMMECSSIPSYVIDGTFLSKDASSLITSMSARAEKIAARLAFIAFLANIKDAVKSLNGKGDDHLNIMFSYVAKDLTVPILQAYADNPRDVAEKQISMILQDMCMRAELNLIEMGGTFAGETKSTWAQSFVQDAQLETFWTNLHKSPLATPWAKSLKRTANENADKMNLISIFLSTILGYLQLLGGSDDKYYTSYFKTQSEFKKEEASTTKPSYYKRAVFQQLLFDVKRNLLPDVGTWVPAVSATLNFYQLGFLMDPHNYIVPSGRRDKDKQTKILKEFTHEDDKNLVKSFNQSLLVINTKNLIITPATTNAILNEFRGFIKDRIELSRRFNSIIVLSYLHAVVKDTPSETISALTAQLEPFKKSIKNLTDRMKNQGEDLIFNNGLLSEEYQKHTTLKDFLVLPDESFINLKALIKPEDHVIFWEAWGGAFIPVSKLLGFAHLMMHVTNPWTWILEKEFKAVADIIKGTDKVTDYIKNYILDITGATNRVPFDLLVMTHISDVIHRSYVGPLFSARKDQRNKFVASPVKKIVISSDGRDTTKRHDSIKESIKIISPSTIAFYDLLYLSSKGLSMQYYDMLNSYPDRPLPVLIKPSSKHVQMQWLGMFTTPDFFVYKDPKTVDSVNDLLSNVFVSAMQTSDMIGTMQETSDTPSKSGGFWENAIGGRSSTYKRRLDEIINNLEGHVTKTRFASDFNKMQLADRIARHTFGKDITDANTLDFNKEVDNISNAIGLNDNNIDPKVDDITKLNSVDDAKKIQVDNKTGSIYHVAVKLSQSQGEIQKKGDISLIPDFMKYKNGMEQDIMTVRILKKLKSIQRNKFLSKSDKLLIDKIMNPSAGAYTRASFNIMQRRLTKSKADGIKTRMPSSFGLTMPTYKLYIIEEDNKEFLFANDFYSYGSVIDISVNSNRKRATSVAVIKLTNMYGKLSNVTSERLTVENPFTVKPENEENVSSMMLRPGAMIQIRLGYNSYLGPETVVFAGEISSIEGMDVLTITAQGWGSQLTKPIGTGAGEDFGSLLNLTPLGGKTYTDLGLVSNILDLNKEMNHLGSRSPFLGQLYARKIGAHEYQKLISSIVLKTLVNVASAATGLTVQMYDTRLANVNLTADQGITIPRRWLVYNETAWEALDDFVLQRMGYHLMTRPFDEEETLIIDNDDGVYQYTLENSIETGRYLPYITALMDGSRREETAYLVLQKILRDEKGQVGDTDADMNANYPERPVFREVKDVLIQTIVELNNGSLELGIGQTIDELLESVITSNYKINKMREFGNLSMGDYDKLETSLLIPSMTTTDNTFENFTEDQLTTNEKNANRMKLFEWALGKALPTACKVLAWKLAAACPGFSPVSASHVKTSSKDIIKNNIKLESGFNRVDLSYINETFLGWVVSTLGWGEFGATIFGSSMSNISLESIEKPSNRQNITVSASPTLEAAAIVTYATFQKNAQIRNGFRNAYEYIVANSILANLIRDYYGGELILTMDQNIRPHDTILLFDTTNDMWGTIGVKEVTHRISKETGAITIVVPDVYVTSRIDSNRQTFSSTAGWGRLLSWIGQGVAFAGTMAAGQLLLGGFGKLATGLFSKMKPFVALATKKMLGGIGKGATAETVKFASKQLLSGAKNVESFKAITGDMLKSFETSKQAFTKTAAQSGKYTDQLIEGLKKIDTSGEKDVTILATEMSELLSKSVSGTGKYQSLLDASLNELGDIFKLSFSTQISLDVMRKALTTNYLSLINGSWGGMRQVKELRTGAGKLVTKGTRGEGALAIVQTLSIGVPLQILKWGVYSKIGTAFIGDIPAAIGGFNAYLGEFLYNQNPLVVSGLIHKGEPFIGNLEGMRKKQFENWFEPMSYRLSRMLEPIGELGGGLEETYKSITDTYQDLKSSSDM